MIVPVALDLLGMIGVVLYFTVVPSLWLLVPSVLLSVAGTFLLLSLLVAMQQPRLAYEAEELLIYLDEPQPVRIPVEIVECFFAGQGPSFLPTIQGREPEVSNVIVRLAESALDWHHRDTKPQIAHWCEGYITIRGAWCEPIGNEALGRLNKRLVEVQRERKARLAAEKAAT